MKSPESSTESAASPKAAITSRLKDGLLEIKLDGHTTKYRVVKFKDTPAVIRAIRLVKLTPDGEDADNYDLSLTIDGITCECWPYLNEQTCKHSRAAKALNLLSEAP